MSSDLDESISGGAAWLATLGILMITAGIVATIVPIFSPNSIVLVLACVFLASGLLRLTQTFKAIGSPNLILAISTGVLDILVAILLFTVLAGTVIPLRFIIGATLILEGILENILATRMTASKGKSWVFVSGIVSLVLGIAAVSGLAAGIGWILALFVGLSLAATGLWFLVLSLSIRDRLSS